MAYNKIENDDNIYKILKHTERHLFNEKGLFSQSHI